MNKEIVLGLHLYQPPRTASHKNLKHIQTDPQKIDWTKKINEQCYKALSQKGIFDKASYTCYGILREQLASIDQLTSNKIIDSFPQNGVGDPFIHIPFTRLTGEEKKLATEDKEIMVGASIQNLGFTPKYFWAPESMLDYETLNILLKFGYRGVICAPEQIKLMSGESAEDKVCVLKLPKKQKILAIPFNRNFSGALSFMDSNEWNADAFTARAFKKDITDHTSPNFPLIIWTDGETFGHHLPKANADFLDRLLSVSLPRIGIQPISINDVKTEVTQEGVLIERTSWSCPHGNISRWHTACSCSSGDLRWKNFFYLAHYKFNAEVTKIVKDELGLSDQDYLELLTKSFDKHFKNPRGIYTTPKLSLISAKVSALTSRTSCGTFFDNPHTSGNINLLFAIQAIEHLKDAGLTKEASIVESNYRKNLKMIIDPLNPKQTVSNMLDNLLNQ